MKKKSFYRWLLLPLFLLVLTSFSAEAYTASGTYTYTSGTGPGSLAFTISTSEFVCDGPTIGADSTNVASLTAKEMIWQNASDTTIWTRSGGTAGDISGIWSASNAGAVYTVTFNSDGSVSMTADVTHCNIDKPPTIASFAPAAAMAGTLVTITGSNFSPILTDNNVTFNGVSAVVTGARPSALSVLVPAGNANGAISVTNSGGTATSSTPFSVTEGTPAVTISWGGVYHRFDLDGTEFDALDVGTSGYATTISGMTLSVAGPNGFKYTFSDADILKYINGQLTFNKRYPTPATPLAPGVYTFTLNDGNGNISHRADTHVTVSGSLPPVDSATIELLRKADGSYRISWAPVNSTKTYYYRVRINRNDTAETYIYDSTRAMTSFADVSAGILFDDSTYKLRVEVVDSPTVDLVTNRSLSAWKLFTPQEGDYDAKRLMFYYLNANNRIDSDGSKKVNFGFGVCATNSACNPEAATSGGNAFAAALGTTASAVLTGPNGFTYTFKSTDHSGSDFSLTLEPGANVPIGTYKFHIFYNGVAYDSNATLTAPVDYPIPTLAQYQAENLDNLPTGNIRFSWVNVDRTGALYYRVQVLDNVTKQYFTSSRLNQTYADMTKASLGDLTNKMWRVEVYDSTSSNTQRNRVNGPWTAVGSLASLPAYDATKPVINGYMGFNMNYLGGFAATFFLIDASDSDGSIALRRVDGPGGYIRTLLSLDQYFQNSYSLGEAGSPAAGLYTITAVDNTGKTAVRYKYQPTPHAIPAVDYHTFKVDPEPNGETRISWAPVVSDVPIWYFFEAWNMNNLATLSIPSGYVAGTVMQQASITVPASYMGGQVMFRIVAADGSNATTQNNASNSVVVKSQPGLEYSTLVDTDGDGFASNVDANDNDPNINPFKPGMVGIPGDCDNNKTVTIAEVQSAINMFLGVNPVKACVDLNNSSTVSIDEVQKVINSFLGL